MKNTISKVSTDGVKPRLITVAEYDRMIEAGIYTENDRIELLNGMKPIIQKKYLCLSVSICGKNSFCCHRKNFNDSCFICIRNRK